MTDVSEQSVAREPECAEQIDGIDAIIEGLRAELNACPATRKGYREAAGIRDSILIWKGQRERVLAAALLAAPRAGEV